MDRVFLECLRSQTPIEVPSAFVPIQHRPFEPSATTFDREPSEFDEKFAADSMASKFGTYEQVLEINAWFAQKRRVARKKEREARVGPAIAFFEFSNEDLSGRTRTEQSRA